MFEYIVVFLVLVVGYVAYLIYDFKKTDRQLESQPEPESNVSSQLIPREINFDLLPPISIEELHKFDGKQSEKVYVAIKSIVFDVSASEAYKIGGSYAVFSGQDASIALGKMDLTGKFLNEYGITKQDSPQEIQTMNEWVSFFQQRYPVVAKISNKKNE